MSQLNTKGKPVLSFVALLSTGPECPPPASPGLQNLPGWSPTHLISTDRRVELAFTEAGMSPEDKTLTAREKLTLIVGDDAEWDETQGSSCMANAACIEWDPERNCLRVLSSIVALPPIFIYRKAGIIAVASELHLLRAIVRSPIAVDPQAVVELFEVGHPLENRTLFKDITLMPGGHSFRANALGLDELTRAWDPLDPNPEIDWSSYIDLQVKAFRQAVSKLQLSDSIFSLTGGLDTRAILAVLSETGIKLTACTISGGRTLCLDARHAKALCKAYGLAHTTVALDEQFLRNLPAYVVEASRFSGGLASIEQAHEVYFYRQLKGLGSKRLSGILGNQIGRCGVEGVSTRNAALSVLHDTLRATTLAGSDEHWLSKASRRSGYSLRQLLLQYEVPFSSLGNYGIGSHFMTQQTPYANRRLIEVSLRTPPIGNGEGRIFVPSHARLLDLRHRFLGPPRAKSFQCKVIEESGGVAADWPINWGWRIKSGVSLRGLGWGILAFADAVSSQPHFLSKLMRQSLRFVGADGVDEIKQPRVWFNTVLREFVNDNLRSRWMTQSDLFNATTVIQLLDEHYSGTRAHYTTLVATLDLILAQQLFDVFPKRNTGLAMPILKTYTGPQE